MNVEIERKFLVDLEFVDYKSFPSQEFMQIYLCIDHHNHTRIKIKNGVDATLGVKVLKMNNLVAIHRYEYESEIALEAAKELMVLSPYFLVEKTLYDYKHGDQVIEIAEYHGLNKGLILAEIEFESEDDSRNYEVPPFLIEDVSHNLKYFNSYLSTNPFKNWENE